MSITSWNNTKTNDNRLVFSIITGDTITFQVTTDIPIKKYIWCINQKEQAGANGNQFTYTIPDILINYDVTVRADSGTPEIGIDLSKFSLNTWTLTKSIIIQIIPSGDTTGTTDITNIQTAITDIGNVGGGIIELKTGTFYINDVIWINKNNITVVGQGIAGTKVIQKTDNIGGIVIMFRKDWWIKTLDNLFDWSWKYPYSIGSGYNTYGKYDSEFIYNATIAKLYLFYPGSGTENTGAWVKYSDNFVGIAAVETHNLTISQVEVEGNSTRSNPYALWVSWYTDPLINDSIFHDTGKGLWIGGYGLRGKLLYNTIYNNLGGIGSIELNGVMGCSDINELTNADLPWQGPCEKVLIKGNVIKKADKITAGMMWIYSSAHIEVTQNVLEGIYDNYAIWVDQPYLFGNSGVIEISKNIVKGTNYSIGAGICIKPAYNFPGLLTINIKNNLVYNNSNLTGILVQRYWNSGPVTVNVDSNTIYGNTNGLQLEQDTYTTISAKNNIIINNSGYGLVGTSIHSYNNIFNNTLGSYSGTTTETGEISVDPLFADIATFDFHLKSQNGRWYSGNWVTDLITSQCISAGDPTSDNSLSPWGGTIEIGAYGNTAESSNPLSSVCPIPQCSLIIT